MNFARQVRRQSLIFSSALLVLTAGFETANADRIESGELRTARQDNRSGSSGRSGNNGGFFNFLDFSNGSRRNNPYGEIPRAPRSGSNSYSVSYYTYKTNRHVALSAPLLRLPQSTASTDASLAVGNGNLDDSLAQTIFDTLKSGAVYLRITTQQRDAIVAAYQARGFEALWTSMDGIEDRAHGVLSVLQTASKEGFDVDDYALPVITGMGSLDAVETDLSAIARFDIEMTALALRYAMNASGGTINPNRLSGYHDLKTPGLAAGKALRRLTNATAPGDFLLALQPTHPAYAAMRIALAETANLVEIERQPEPVPAGLTLVPGMNDFRIGMVRARLITLGHLGTDDPQDQDTSIETIEPAAQELPLAGSDDLPIEETSGTAANFYDREMAKAVRDFQRSAGLKPDALIGPATLRKLNGDRPESFDKAKRLRANMERLRWLPRNLGRRHIFVNQASYKLQVVDNGRTVWRTKVIVGKPKNQTSFFSDVMESVVFNPYWGVPQSIIVNEMLPKLQNDPGYLDRQGYEVLSPSGRKISSYNVDWWQYYDKVPYGVRQPPGRRNALGEVKFLFPNKHAIYMHDTPTKKLFTRNERAFSHGCVRVKNPRELVNAVLGWDQYRIASTISTGRNTKVPLDRKFNVHLTYFTAWPDSSGEIKYVRDVYGRDSRIELAFEATRRATN